MVKQPGGFDDWMENRYQENCCIVAGSLTEGEESLQRFLVALTKAADYYRVINVVMTPEQKAAFDMLVPDVLCVNYIVDPAASALDFFAGFIRETRYDNVAQRVIINKCIPSTTSAVIERLGLVEDMEVHVTTIPYEPHNGVQHPGRQTAAPRGRAGSIQRGM